MNTNLSFFDADEEAFDIMRDIQPCDLRKLAVTALAQGKSVQVSNFWSEEYGRGTIVITPDRAALCYNGDGIFGDWITPANGEGYLLTEDGDKYDINGNHLGGEHLCENCQQSNKLTPATGTRFWKKAFGNAEDRDVRLCSECAIISDDYESL